MNANENLEQKRKNVIVELGVVLMKISLVLFLLTFFCSYAIVIPAHLMPSSDQSAPFYLYLEGLIFMHGLVVFLIGRLISLLKMQKANESLEQKRKEAIAIVKLGVVLMSIGIIPLFYFYTIINPARGPFGGIPDTVLDSLFIGTVLFVLGLIVVLIIGVLNFVFFLIGRLKKQESL